jgi:tetratricopeptide (TPR) repeat protein
MKKTLLLYAFLITVNLSVKSATAQTLDQSIKDTKQVIKTGVETISEITSLFRSKKPKDKKNAKKETETPARSTDKIEVYTPETTDRSASTVDAMKWYQESEAQPVPEKKIESLNKAIKADPAFVDAYYNRAYYLGELKLYEKAINDLNQVLTFRPTDAGALNDRGFYKLALERYEEAIKDFGQSIANNFDNLSLVYKNRGMAHMALGGNNLPNALRDFDNALLHKTDYFDAKYSKASCLQEMNQHKEALGVLNELVLQTPKSAEVWYLRGVSNAALRQDQEAINDYSNVLKQQPDFADAYFARGIVKMTMTNYDGAIEDYAQVIRLDKTFAEAYNNRGFCYVRKKKKEYELAIRDFTESINQGHSDKYLVYTNRGDAQFRLGSYPEAKKDYQLALADKPGHPQAIQGLQQSDAILNPSGSKSVAGVRQSNLLKRYALVIGNSKYAYSKPLEGKPLNDSDDIVQRFEEMGFQTKKLQDATLSDMDQAINTLVQQAKGADLVTIFFAGHGIEADKKNYLIPIDARLAKPEDAPHEAISLDNLLDRLKSSHAKMNLIFLDACRNDPFRSWDILGRDSDSTAAARMRAFGAPPKLSSDVMVYYATQPKDVAGNGSGRNGNLTTGLLKHLRRGIELKEMWQDVTNSVYRDITKEVQLPYSAGTLTMDLIF